MFRFLLKKAFFDGWDRFFTMVLLNVPFTALIAGEGVVAMTILSGREGNPFLLLELGILALLAVPLSLYAGACTWMVNGMADFSTPRWSELLEGFRKTWWKSALFGLLAAFSVFSCLYGTLFFLGRWGLAGAALAGIFLWTAIFLLLAWQWFFPAMVRLGGSFPKLLRRCALLALDNPGFSFALLLTGALAFPVSLLLGGLLPGPSGHLLFLCDALRLRARKYDWLESHPGADRKKIPWEELLAEDRELVGKRSFSGFLFPWKDSN